MTDLAQYQTCTCGQRATDGYGEPLQPAIVTCGTCGFQWCERCHPAPSARSWCEGSDRHNKAHDDHEQRKHEQAISRAIVLLLANGYTVTSHETDA